MDGYICSFQVNFNELWMNKKSLLKHEYLGADKKYHPFSIQHVLFHELMHAADGLLTKHNKEVQKAHIVNILKSHPNIDYAEYKFSETEIPATSATNRFIAPHYKETLRANYFDVREKLKSSGVVNGSQFFHDHIDLPPAQQLPPKQNTPGHNKR